MREVTRYRPARRCGRASTSRASTGSHGVAVIRKARSGNAYSAKSSSRALSAIGGLPRARASSCRARCTASFRRPEAATTSIVYDPRILTGNRPLRRSRAKSAASTYASPTICASRRTVRRHDLIALQVVTVGARASRSAIDALQRANATAKRITCTGFRCSRPRRWPNYMHRRIRARVRASDESRKALLAGATARVRISRSTRPCGACSTPSGTSARR